MGTLWSKGVTSKYSQAMRSRMPGEGNISAKNNVTSEYDMWSWIFQEIANIRMEVSRLSTLVRINNVNSPAYLEIYHAHIYSLLIVVSPLVRYSVWHKIDALWLDTAEEIKSFLVIQQSVPDKKIDFELIRKLDKLYRIALRIIQFVGLGVRVTASHDENAAMEKMIGGE